MPEFLLDLLMRTAEEIPDRCAKKHFIGEQCREVWRLFEPLMSGDARAAL